MSESRDKGKRLEELVASELRQALGENGIRPTKASGGGSHNSELGDVVNPLFVIECKNHNHKNIQFEKAVWDKLCNEIPMNSTKIPLYVVRYQEKDDFVMMKLSDLMYLLKEKK